MKITDHLSLITTLLASILGAHLLLATNIAFAQGSLTSPVPPTPTMKSLDQIEARIPISSLPYTITQSGSYYLTQNLTASGSGAGITVTPNDVTLDLNGFALTGGGAGAVTGIQVNSVGGVCIRNGLVRGSTRGGIKSTASTKRPRISSIDCRSYAPPSVST